MVKKLIKTFAVLAVLTKIISANVPVLILGSSSALKPALNTLSTSDFSSLISPHLDNAMALVFSEDRLTGQEFSLCKTETGEACFENIEEIKPRTYYLGVENPIEAIRDTTSNREYVNINSEGNLESLISFETGKVVFIEFYENEASYNENTKLKGHSDTIANIYKELSSFGNVIIVYTGKHDNVLARKTREAQVSNENTPVNAGSAASQPKVEQATPSCHNISDIVFLCYQNIKYNGKPVIITSATLHSDTKNSSEVELIAGTDTLKFKCISGENGYWSIKDMRWNNNLLKSSESIIVPRTFSYYCSAPITYRAKDDSISIMGLQIQGNFESNPNFKFGDAWHCVGFTSPAIWSGLFVTFMMLAILSIGISWMLDINTMDRFDDPKGKTITINVTE